MLNSTEKVHLKKIGVHLETGVELIQTLRAKLNIKKKKKKKKPHLKIYNKEENKKLIKLTNSPLCKQRFN